MNIKKNLSYILLLGYLIGIHNGRIAIWKGEDPEPFLTLPYAASMLPDEDQHRLKAGIRIDSKEELAQLIEDYCS